MSDKFPGNIVTTGAPAGFSVAFNGSSDYITVPQSTNLDLGSGNWTIEAWVYATSNSGNRRVINKQNGSNAWIFRLNSSGTGSVVYFEIDTVAIVTGTTVIPNNKWTHIAVVRNSNTVTAYVNGVSDASATYSGTPSAPSAVTAVGAYAGGPSEYFPGYISNARFVKGSAVYTAAFTPPTQLFPITNTQLLTCQSPTLIDNSTNAATITAVSGAKVSNFTPFAGYTGFNPALGAAAGGVWTLDQAEYYQANRQWPIYDPYFKNTTLMLHGNGTNGAQNNTFLDSSTNNFTITRNGNTTQGTFTPFSQTGWSNYFNGSGSLSTGTSTSLAFGTGDFTIEFWVNLVSYNGTYTSLFSTRTAGDAGGNGLDIQILLTGGNYQLMIGNPASAIIYANNVTSLNTWMHIAATRVSGVMYLFVNGAQVATGASTYNFTIGNAYWGAGAGGSNNSVCYISNLRVLKGTGLYSSSFTPSTQPLNVVTNTVLLSAQSNRFVDNSANNFTLTYNGSGTTVQAFSPFVPAYITPTTYSNWFDGSGDYLSLASNAAFNIFNGDMTIECWFNQTSTTNASQHLFAFVQDATNRESIYFNGTTLTFWTSSGAGSGPRITYSAPTLNAWHHLAIVKSGSTFTMYVDGISAGTSTTTQYSTASQSLKIATYDGTVAADYFTGVISNVRIVKGTAVYTANFTPPTAPLTAITNTQLLTCQSSTFIDNSTNAFTVTPTGNVQPVTSPTPFNPNVDQTTLNSAYSTTLIGGSYYGAATGDYLSFTDSSNLLDMGTTAASFECWYYMTATGAYQNIFLKYGGTAGWNATNGIEYGFAINNGVPTLSYFTGGTSLASISDPTTRTVNQWYHFAIATDASNNISMYVNGVRVANATSAISKPTTRTTVNIGSTSGQYVVGYLAGMRFLTGANAYNAASLNIGVPPLTPPTAVSGTQLLCNFTNGGIFDDTAKNVLQTVGDAQISTTQSKWGGSSLKFDGTGDWLVMRSTAGDYLQLGGTSRPFTIEAWTYPTSFATNVTIAERGGGNANWTSTTGIQYTWFFKNSDSKMYWQYYAGGTSVNSISSSVTISLNTWTHVAVSYDGTTTYLFVNGVQVGTGTSAYTIPSAPTQMRIGAETDGSNPFFGYIDDLRVTQGVARYVTNFTPPTSALQNQ